ncbi:hypothetical protein VNO77_32179 [Canavalia gladiata]|uniref:Uncharacterized protein n=1 Tax=Canavalia gladiata TaxID=3824 RepID=A0AAN9Q839_CANGL
MFAPFGSSYFCESFNWTGYATKKFLHPWNLYSDQVSDLHLIHLISYLRHSVFLADWLRSKIIEYALDLILPALSVARLLKPESVCKLILLSGGCSVNLLPRILESNEDPVNQFLHDGHHSRLPSPIIHSRDIGQVPTAASHSISYYPHPLAKHETGLTLAHQLNFVIPAPERLEPIQCMTFFLMISNTVCGSNSKMVMKEDSEFKIMNTQVEQAKDLREANAVKYEHMLTFLT